MENGLDVGTAGMMEDAGCLELAETTSGPAYCLLPGLSLEDALTSTRVYDSLRAKWRIASAKGNP